MALQRDFSTILIERDRVAQRVHELGHQITRDLREAGVNLDDPQAANSRVVIIAVLTGAMVFVADLIREMPVKLHIELVAVSSYPGTSVESKGVKMKTALPSDLGGAHVLLIDDILDSGQTLHTLVDLIGRQHPASLRTCVLLRKPGKAKIDIKPDYVGFDIPDEFVVGYGLDFDGLYRNFPGIAVLRR